MAGVADLATLSTGAAYALLAVLVFAESGVLLGFFLPGDTVLFAAGLLTGTGGALSLPVLVAIVLVTAVTGDAVGYATGRRAGPALFERRAGRVLNPDTLDRARHFYARHGAIAVIAARWIPWVRTFTPLMAGAARMPYPRFLVANVVGAITWGAGLLVLGHLAASSPAVRSSAAGVAATVVGVSVVGGAARHLRRRRAKAD